MSTLSAAKTADFRGPLDVARAATVVLDAQDTVIGWSHAAEGLLGYPQNEIVGRPLATFLSPRQASESAADQEPAPASGTPLSGSEIRVAQHRDGRSLLVATLECPLPGAGAAARVLVAAELEQLRLWESRLALLHGLATQSPVGLGIYDTDLRLTWCNAAYEREIGLPFAEFRGLRADEMYSEGRFVTKGYPDTLDAVMHHVLDTGEPIVDLHFRGEPPSDPGKTHLWSCSYYRLQDADGHVFGLCEDAFDITDRYEAQRRLALLVEAGRAVGTALDVIVTAEEITEVAVPEFADTVTVDLLKEVLEGEVPAADGRGHLLSYGPPPAPPGRRAGRAAPAIRRSRVGLRLSPTRLVRRSTAPSPPAGSRWWTTPWSCRCGRGRHAGTHHLPPQCPGRHVRERRGRTRRRAGGPYGGVHRQRPALHP